MSNKVEKANVDVPPAGLSFAQLVEHFGVDVVVSESRKLVQDKHELVGLPFIVTRWVWRIDQLTGRDYVSVEATTVEDVEIVFNDGSTGIMAQLSELEKRIGRNGGVICQGGLRASEYPVGENGKPLPAGSTEKPASIATTFYLA